MQYRKSLAIHKKNIKKLITLYNIKKYRIAKNPCIAISLSCLH